MLLSGLDCYKESVFTLTFITPLHTVIVFLLLFVFCFFFCFWLLLKFFYICFQQFNYVVP